MTLELKDFRERVLAHAKLVASRAPSVKNEASTNTSLVQPFLTLLGYDVGNPDEVTPEHHADFSEKFQNRVDYAILHRGVPVIALESKAVRSVMKDARGQLRAYFNALQTVKLGILTNGLKYEFYTDSVALHMMDETAYLRIDLAEVAKYGTIDDNALGGIARIRKGLFNPGEVVPEAKRQFLFESIVETIKKEFKSPSNDYVRFILGRSSVGKITQKIVDASRDIVRSAMEAFVAQEALARFDDASKDVERPPQEPDASKKPPAQSFAPAPEGAKVSKFLTKPLKQYGYKKQKGRSTEGHIVYKNEAGQEIHVGPGKSEKAYLMGWRTPGQAGTHNYGGPTLEKYLAAR